MYYTCPVTWKMKYSSNGFHGIKLEGWKPLLNFHEFILNLITEGTFKIEHLGYRRILIHTFHDLSSEKFKYS